MDLKKIRITAYGEYEVNHDTVRSFNMIDNYIYLYHTQTFVVLPTFPESITDSMGAQFNPDSPLSRSAPLFSYSHSGPRNVNFSFSFHREMMYDINHNTSTFKDLLNDDYVDTLVKNLQSIAVPSYAVAKKMVNPPMVAIRLGNEIFCRGVVNGDVSVTYGLPILSGKYDGKYAQVGVSFNVSEVDPFSAEDIANMGSFRGLISNDLMRGAIK